MQYKTKKTKYKHINTNKSMHSEIVTLWQNPFQKNCKNCSS